MKFTSTRNKSISITGTQAIVQGLSHEGGLFVPLTFPAVTKQEFEKFCTLEYPDRATFVLSKFLPELASKLQAATKNAYSKFEDGDAAPLVKLTDSIYMLELWHGPTYAFKDVALTLLPHLMADSKLVVGDNSTTLILVATSGDTGKAALEGFRNAKGIKIVVLYPSEGVSNLQKLQMQTTSGDNVAVYGIEGNFDDAQNTVKEIFQDKTIADSLAKKSIMLSSANSINFGRLAPQIVYYFSSYADMVNSNQIKYGDKVNFCVPTGNFGNILAGYYAKKMGLPIKKLICASNKNNVLADFVNLGEYSLAREFYKTTSPSMDILISSNLERLLFELSNRDDKLTSTRMSDLKVKGKYAVTKQELKNIQDEFYAGFSEEDSVKDTIADYFDEYGYIVDTHTAVALNVYNQYVEKTNDTTKTVVVSTASPYKFVADVLTAIEESPTGNDKKDVELLEEITALEIPTSLKELFKTKVIHKKVLKKAAVTKSIVEYAYSIGN